MPAHRSPFTHTRLVHLSPGTALGLLLALILVIGAGLAMRPSGTPGGAAGGGDAALYRQIAARVAGGEAYYPAAAAEHRASGYPLKPFTAVRQPLLAEIAATVGPVGAEWLLRLLAVAATAATVIRLVPRLKTPFREIAILLSATSAGAFVQSGMWVWHEIWAGLLITLALACRTERHWLFSVALGLTAALLRELAFPFLLVMAGTARASGNRGEARAWIGAAAIATASLTLHMISVGAVALPSDVTSPGWLGLGGWRFDLALARQSSLLMGLPVWVAAVATPLALLGWCAWPGAYALRTAAMLGVWMAAFLVFGRPDNSYWGFLFAPLLPVGLALVPAALRDLVRASRPLLAGTAGTPITH
ncbi:MAG TPA: hypothetical protein VK533_14495 [Sphingomonas sp.]|uniref:hypothetical protein n=1 Tax=Sphingomonas sp. TaxID=28214 RepID=UPI002C67ADC7|nr:hypothetical protein [Sphingomonas sp.]HMI20743.1 hypothetical protein [Sphingomonas sp.]